MKRTIGARLLFGLLATPSTAAAVDGLSGSLSSMARQHRVAVKEEYSFLRSGNEVRKLATLGALVPVTESEDLALSKVSYPFARPEVRGFVERFAATYRDSTGSRLVVTSLTRPASAQPRNAHKLSVHPAGMAVDLRVPVDPHARAYLERSLLALEKAGVLDVTRERSPAHYHIAVFADKYAPYAARHDSIAAVRRAELAAKPPTVRLQPRSVGGPAATDGGSVPGLLLGMLALVGVTAPVIYRGSRTRRSRRATEEQHGP